MRTDKFEPAEMQHYVPPTLAPSITQTNAYTQSSGQTGSAGTQSGTNANTYTPQQQSAQGTALSQLSNVLNGGSISSSLGLPQAAWDAAIANYKNNVLPLDMAQNGEGSQAGMSGLSQLIQQLAGMSGQQQVQNFQGLTGELGNLAFTPVGNTANQANTAAGTANQQNIGQSQTSAFNPGGAIDALAGILGSAIQNLKF